MLIEVMMLPDRDVVRVENRSGRCWVISKDSSRETLPRVNQTSARRGRCACGS